MADTSNKYGSYTALTVTNLQSLANGGWWQSAEIDNSTTKATWAEIYITLVTTTTAASAIGRIKACFGAKNNAGSYAGGLSGAQGTYTPTENNDKQLTVIESVAIDATGTTARTLVVRMVMRDLPAKFALAIKQEIGTALGASGNLVEIYLNAHTIA